jgi:CRP-like cAMP-binding protein
MQSLAQPEQGDAAQRCLSVVGLTQHELAKMIGVSRSWVAIALSEFERLGLISKSRGKIVIRNAKRLDAFIADERNY